MREFENLKMKIKPRTRYRNEERGSNLLYNNKRF